MLLWRHLSYQLGWWPPFLLFFLFGRQLPKDRFCHVWGNYYCRIFFVKTWKFSFQASTFYSKSATLAPPILSAGLMTPFFLFSLEDNYPKIDSATYLVSRLVTPFFHFYLEYSFPKILPSLRKLLLPDLFCEDLEFQLPSLHFLLNKCYSGATYLISRAGDPLFSSFILEEDYPKMNSAQFEKIIIVGYFL